MSQVKPPYFQIFKTTVRYTFRTGKAGANERWVSVKKEPVHRRFTKGRGVTRLYQNHFFFNFSFLKSFLFCTGVQPSSKQHCDSFGEQQGTQPHIHMHPLPPNSPPIQAAISHQAEFPALCSGSLPTLHFKYSSVYMSIPKFLTVPPTHPSPTVGS